MNAHPIQLDIVCRNSSTIYYLIAVNQVSEEWMKNLLELHGRASDDCELDFVGDVLCACVEHFVGSGDGLRSWVQTVRENGPNRMDHFNYKAKDIKFFREGCELMHKWLTPGHRDMWRGQFRSSPFEVHGTVYHIIHHTN